MFNQVKVAVVQAAPVLFDNKSTLNKIIELTKRAAADDAKIVLFSESFLPGYPQIFDSRLKIDYYSPEGQKLYRRFYESSITDNGPEAQILSALAAEAKVHLAVGATENDGRNLFCSMFFWGPDGTFLGKHRKLKPTGFERLIWSQGDGSILTTLDTEYGKMGAAICWENYMPLLRATMYAKGVSIYLAPTADSSQHWQCTIQHIALEGRCFLLSCNHYLCKEMIPEDLTQLGCAPPDLDLMYRGGSAIISPKGEYLAGPLYDQEGILMADLDLGQIYEARYDFDPIGHYSRNDVFTLIVNDRRQKGIEFVDEEDETD